MIHLFYQGGPLFMGILTVILAILLFVFIRSLFKELEVNELHQSIKWLKSIGTLALVVGILGQLIGLFEAFSFIETSKGISPALLAAGLKISMITTLYGMMIYILYLATSMILRRKL